MDAEKHIWMSTTKQKDLLFTERQDKMNVSSRHQPSTIIGIHPYPLFTDELFDELFALSFKVLIEFLPYACDCPLSLCPRLAGASSDEF